MERATSRDRRMTNEEKLAEEYYTDDIMYWKEIELPKE